MPAYRKVSSIRETNDIVETTGCCPNLRRLAGWHQVPVRPSRAEQAAQVLVERAPLASYFFLALFVSRAFATKASNRGSLCRDFNSGSAESSPGEMRLFSMAWFRS